METPVNREQYAKLFELDIRDFEEKRLAIRQAGSDEVLHQFLLRVNHHRFADEVLEIHPPQLAFEFDVEAAVQNALSRAGKTIRNMRWFEVVETRGYIEKNKIDHWQVTIKVGFTLES